MGDSPGGGLAEFGWECKYLDVEIFIDFDSFAKYENVLHEV